jgi:DNA-binding NarL/FixJ family response regulator
MAQFGFHPGGFRRSLVVAEPVELVREGLAALCEGLWGFEVAAQCADGEAALHAIRAHQPDAALLDLGLARLFTLEVVRKAREERLATRVVVLGARADRKTVVEVLRSGASAYVLKDSPRQHLFDAFRQVFEGGVYVSPLVSLERVFVQSRPLRHEDPLAMLSPREYQVFTMLVEGVRAKEIAARLELSPKTVDTYRSSLMRKLDIHDVAGLVKFALQHQLTALA